MDDEKAMKQQMHPSVTLACLVVIMAGIKTSASHVNPFLLAVLQWNAPLALTDRKGSSLA